MKIYIPVYDHGRHKVEEVETKDAVYRKAPGFPATVTYRCYIYNGDDLFTDPEGVQLFWQKEYNAALQYRISPYDPRILWRGWTSQ